MEQGRKKCFSEPFLRNYLQFFGVFTYFCWDIGTTSFRFSSSDKVDSNFQILNGRPCDVLVIIFCLFVLFQLFLGFLNLFIQFWFLVDFDFLNGKTQLAMEFTQPHEFVRIRYNYKKPWNKKQNQFSRKRLTKLFFWTWFDITQLSN